MVKHDVFLKVLTISSFMYIFLFNSFSVFLLFGID